MSTYYRKPVSTLIQSISAFSGKRLGLRNAVGYCDVLDCSTNEIVYSATTLAKLYGVLLAECIEKSIDFETVPDIDTPNENDAMLAELEDAN